MAPSVTVVIPTCDRPQLLLQAVSSVLAQQRLPSEVLVVDAGRGAGVVGVAGELAAGGRVSVLQARGCGPGAARNAGIRAARGELIAFLDDDDLWRPEKLARQAECLAVMPELGLVGTRAVRVASGGSGPGGVLADGVAPASPREVGMASLVRANRFVMSSVVVRRRCFEDCGLFDESLPLAQDWDMWLRISERWKTAILPAPLTIYCLHGGQRSAQRLEMRRCETEVIRRVVNRRPASGGLRAVARRRLAWAQCRLGRALWREGRREIGVGAFQADWKSALLASVRGNPLCLPAWTGLARCLTGRWFAAEARQA